MSDTSQGPGWWLAADGRWYPPQPPVAPPQPPVMPPVQPPPLPPVPMPPAPKRSRLPWILVTIVVVLALVGVGLFLGIRGSSSPSTSAAGRRTNDRMEMKVETSVSETTMVPIDVSNIKLLGDASNPVNEVVRAAIGDLSQYWDNQMPRVFDRKFEPLAGGFYAWTPQTKLPPCAAGPEEISGNAFYCARGDLLAWDAAELLPQMQETYGDLAVGVVIAHEWGHVVQARENKVAATVTLEQQADCYAGAWMRHVEDTKNPAFPLSDNSADRALSGLLDVADQPGTAAGDPRAHGSGFDRVASFQSGYESGVKQCASMTDANTKLVELPFNGVRDLASGGNLPYNQIVDLAMSDLNDYFNVTGAKALGTTWKPIVARPFAAQAGAPTCGSSDTTKFKLFFCSPERYVAFDNTDLFPRLSERVGDYAVATMLATQFGLAVLTDANKMPKDTRKQNLAGDCVAGAWAADVFENRRTGNDNMRLSPGDLDEAIKVLLMFGKGSNSDYGSGFQRVEWYRKGVNGGITACTE